PEDFATYYCQQ
nr:immunoglobulin light chain junction region [Homo sapiens]MCG98718.1 immunoglobulin light chain junction region [Homo sapiens]